MAPSNQDDFDGYRKWLGIADKKRPPTHYELLGVSLDEDDPDVIHAAVEQRRRFVETKRGEGHDSIVTEILYRIAEAESTLLNNDMRQEYDRQQNLFEKRRKNRQVDSHAPRSRFKSRPGKTVGEDSGIVKTFAGIVAVLVVAFAGMACFSFFGLPWSRPPKEAEVAQVQPQVVQPIQPPVQALPEVVVQPPKQPPVEPNKVKDPSAVALKEKDIELQAPDSSLEGEWRFVAGIGAGKPIDDQGSKRRIVITGKNYMLFAGDRVIEGTIKFDATQSPKHLDITPLKGGAPAIAGKVQRGIYELTNAGKSLRFCVGTPEGTRPAMFDGTPKGWSVQVYEKRNTPHENPPPKMVAAPVKAAVEVKLTDEDFLNHWKPYPASESSRWSIKNGVLKLDAEGPSLVTKQNFSDFDLHLEFKLPSKCNTGIYLRGRYEVQLLDSDFRTKDGKAAPPNSSCGSIWGMIAPSKNVYLGPNKWNKMDVRLVGTVVTVRMNDIVIIDSRPLTGVTKDALDAFESEPGPILLQNSYIIGPEFRNITIKPITDAAKQ